MNALSNEGSRTLEEQPLAESSQLATYLVRGSAIVQVSESPMAKSVASLTPGEKILGVDIAKGNSLIWATLQRVEVVAETAKLRNTMIVRLGGDGSLLLRAEQEVLTRNSRKNFDMQPVRRLLVGVDSVVVFNGGGLRFQGSGAQEVKKISSLQLVPEKDSTERFYKLTVG